MTRPDDDADQPAAESGLPTVPASHAVRIDFGQTNKRRLVLGLALLSTAEALLIVAIVAPGVFGTDDANWVVWFLAVVFALILALVLAALPAMLRRPAMAFDEHGVWWLERGTNIAIGWDDISAIGIGTTANPWGGKRHLAWLELYPAKPGFSASRPELSLFRTVAEPPKLDEATGLSEYRYRFAMPADPASSDKVRDAITELREEVWIGHYVR